MKRSIDASTTIRVDFDQARGILLDDPRRVFSETPGVDEPGDHRFSLELGVDLGAGASVRQNVTVQLGAPKSVVDGLMLPLSWHASGREAWLPTFTGQLEASRAREGTRLRLSGIYTVPLGVVGRFGDGVLGRRLARQSLGALLDRLAGHLSCEVQARSGSVSGRPAPHAVDVQDQMHSEIYVG